MKRIPCDATCPKHAPGSPAKPLSRTQQRTLAIQRGESLAPKPDARESFEECPDCGWRPGDELLATHRRELALQALRKLNAIGGLGYAAHDLVDAAIVALESP